MKLSADKLKYGVDTKRLNQQVQRNIERFPEDFMFQLTKEEFESLRSQFATSNVNKTDLTSQNATFFPKTRFRPFDISYIYPRIWYKTAAKICIFEKKAVPLHSRSVLGATDVAWRHKSASRPPLSPTRLIVVSGTP